MSPARVLPEHLRERGGLERLREALAEIDTLLRSSLTRCQRARAYAQRAGIAALLDQAEQQLERGRPPPARDGSSSRPP